MIMILGKKFQLDYPYDIPGRFLEKLTKNRRYIGRMPHCLRQWLSDFFSWFFNHRTKLRNFSSFIATAKSGQAPKRSQRISMHFFINEFTYLGMPHCISRQNSNLPGDPTMSSLFWIHYLDVQKLFVHPVDDLQSKDLHTEDALQLF